MTAPSRATTGNYNYTAAFTRDRIVPVRSVVCPDCNAQVGEGCTPQLHSVRRRMAIRAENADYLAADVEYARRVSPAVRRAVRRRSGLSVAELAEHLGVTRNAVVQWHKNSIPGGPDGARYGVWLREQIEGPR